MSNVPFFRSPYNYDMDGVSRETGLECLDPSLKRRVLKRSRVLSLLSMVSPSFSMTVVMIAGCVG